MLNPEMSIKEAKETLIGLASIPYGCSNLLYRGATLTFFSGILFLIYDIAFLRLGKFQPISVASASP